MEINPCVKPKRMLSSLQRLVQQSGLGVVKFRASVVRSISAVSKNRYRCKPKLAIIALLLHGESEPELFPGACFRCRNIAFLLFSSGKIVVTGLRPNQGSFDMALRSLERMNDVCIGKS